MKRNVLINAGSTTIPIDKVRSITNIFKGRTGSEIAEYFAKKGDNVTLVTSRPQQKVSRSILFIAKAFNWLRGKKQINVVSYRIFDSLHAAMEREVRSGKYDIIIHSAAISDYRVGKIYPAGSQAFETVPGKISSCYDCLIMEWVQTPKLIDFIRGDWEYKKTLVKFKLEVGITDEELIERARKSMLDSDADLMVANCLEWAGEYAYIIDKSGGCEKVSRQELPKKLYGRLE